MHRMAQALSHPRRRGMIDLYEVLRCQKTGIYPDLWTALAARGFNSSGFDHTDERDYIYNGDTIIYYIGKSKRPELPSELDGIKVRVVERTAFSGNAVEAVRIPDGMEVIE